LDKKRRICLFTAHSPLTGGGGVILRSLIAALTDFDISWYYVGNNAEPGYESGYLGKALMGGDPVKDVLNTWKMLADKKMPYFDSLVQQMAAIECDAYWIVSHNEGLRLALELTRQQSRPVHLTVHDDWAGALCARSVRYRFMGGWADKLTAATLKAVDSFDVISAGMRNYYKVLSGKEGEICHRYLQPDAIMHPGVNGDDENAVVTIGHIGSIYDKNDFVAFLSLLREFFNAKGKTPLVKMWGCHLTANDIPASLKGTVSFYDTLPEEKVIPELSACHFVYAMYPLSKALGLFSRTSLPTKLTSYLQAGRPVFGHGPADSTLAAFVTANGLGAMWTSLNKQDGFYALQKVIVVNLEHNEPENVRKQYFGEGNLAVMRRVLSNSK